MTMTEAQTAIYTSNNHAAIDQLHREIDEWLCERKTAYEEIVTADGLTAWIYDERERYIWDWDEETPCAPIG